MAVLSAFRAIAPAFVRQVFQSNGVLVSLCLIEDV
jgi:hypothetical protein